MHRLAVALQFLSTDVAELSYAVLITGLPLNVYTETISEPPTGRFQPPGTTLHLPGVISIRMQYMQEASLGHTKAHITS